MNPEQIVMMKRFIYILLLCLLISCERRVPIVSSDDFKQDVHRFPFSTYNMLCVELYEDNLYHTNRLDNRHLLLYDFKRNIIDTIISDNKVIDIIVVNDSSIFYTDYQIGNYLLKNANDNSYDYFKDVHNTVSHPYWRDDYHCISVFPTQPLTMTDPKSGIVSCVRKHIFAEDYSVILENDIPVYLRFEIAADSSIIPVSFFGEYPKNHPKENYYDGGILYYFYNHKSKEIITHTAVDDYVVLCDSMGNKIQDVYFGSQLYKYSPFSIDKKNKMAESINHYYNATLYSYIGFDEYRNIYYRWMSLPRERDEDSMIKEDVVDYILVVADEKFNIKYEVFFDGDKYHPIPADDLINEKGLLIYEKENKEWKGSHTAAWFVFE